MEGYDDENGPKRVVWAIGKFFFGFSSCFLILMDILLFYFTEYTTEG